VLDDKAVERDRYEGWGRQVLSASAPPPLDGAESLAPILRAPYTFYEQTLGGLLRPGLQVLELGAGMGEHTGSLVRSGASVTCLDIAPAALETITRRFASGINPPKTVIGDIESVPLPSASIDVIVGANFLSYGDPDCVDREIFRVLKPSGSLVCLDSLNHNLIYRLNRWRRFCRGERSRSTLLRMPNLSRIHRLSAPFASTELRFFGSMAWAVAAIAPFVGQETAALLSDRLDVAVGVRRSAFKFVLVARNLRRE